MTLNKPGPLSGIKIVELAGLGPAPMGTMLLADMGASVVRVERPSNSDLLTTFPREFDWTTRGRPSVAADLKNPAHREWVLGLCARADVLVEGFRPGVTERLGLGPEDVSAVNPRLVYARMTGWGQTGPLAMRAGHDINYLAITGGLDAIGRKGAPPTVPLNLVGDFGGGGAYLAMGVLAALIERQSSGKGQVIDVAMVDGISSLMTAIHGMLAAGEWVLERGSNLLDSGAYFYDVYQCADNRWIAVGAIEKHFHDELMRLLGIDLGPSDPRVDRSRWPSMRAQLREKFSARTRDEWQALLEPVDVCVSPVLNMAEASAHPHLKARATFTAVDGAWHPAPAPRFSRTPTGGLERVQEASDGPAELFSYWDSSAMNASSR
ncbi:CaiB/BaiF CoA transferase family protein [Paraburkholderia rhynchosiae]|uniref:Acetyl-CoA:oxalate CoA-transferase n=1 Tax=Paraburkholderia rhynchosiae TaxID=487049 RepID=A0A2N7W7X5_9BURK|nr:CaiB/BaiF CoA-transferase family protein [Paraburkholderia rhynchosiae]PMS25490.1 carnitine dehydratase [Paraburkholderia rhynchosiae]CAB3733931.1 Acetyl-CoA:oxalate CoA-transferase [Paraburkholderia rhynchosiae]